jgi:FMN-dependent NADH-azoreductase
VLTPGAYATNFLSPAFGVDHQSTYLRAWLNQAGVTDFERAKQAAVDLATAHGRA